MTTKTTSSTSNTSAFLGDTFACVGLLLNVGLTGIILLSPEATTDDWWRRVGFCVDYREERIVDTEVLCAIVLCASAIVASLWYYPQYSVTKTTKPKSQLLHDRIVGGIFSNLSHGLGHLFVYALDGPPPPVDISWSVSGLGYCVVLLFFFMGAFCATVPSIPYPIAAILAVVVIFVQYLINVPPELAFTYSQSAILLASSIGLLLSSKEIKGDEASHYPWVCASLLPLFGFFALESTQCQSIMVEYFGGHVLYDLYLAALPLFVIQWSGEPVTPAPPIKAKVH